jgi:hypothetical protein
LLDSSRGGELGSISGLINGSKGGSKGLKDGSEGVVGSEGEKGSLEGSVQK